MSQPQIQTRPINTLKPHPNNVRTHSNKQIKQLVRSLEQFGNTCPIVINEQDVILAGHARWEALKFLKHDHVPVIVAVGLSEAKQRAYILADNKIAANAGWDRQALAIEFKDLAPKLAEIGLTIEDTGFETVEIDGIFHDYLDAEFDPIDTVEANAAKPVSLLGDIWQMGTNRLICGDAHDPTAMQALMNGAAAAMAFTDPPYNVRVSGIQGRGKIKHREFVAGSGELSKNNYIEFLTKALAIAAQHSIDGAIHFVCIDWKHLSQLLAAGELVYAELKNLIVWNKSNAGQGSFYRSKHELICAFKHGDAPHINTFELGQHGRHRSNVWNYPGVNTFRAGRMAELAMHPTVKPVALVADAMRDCSRRGDIVLDPFMGSGTTILAAERVSRLGYGLELDPLYVDTAVRRWQAYAKRDAILTSTGQTFDEVAALRSVKEPCHEEA